MTKEEFFERMYQLEQQLGKGNRLLDERNWREEYVEYRFQRELDSILSPPVPKHSD